MSIIEVWKSNTQLCYVTERNREKEIAWEPIREAGVMVIMSDFLPSNCCQETCETSEPGEGDD